MGIKDQVNLKLYFNGVELSEEKAQIKDCGIPEEGGSLEVEMTIRITVKVQGKGKDYSTLVDVRATDPVEILKQKVHFFKIFIQRKLQLIDLKTNKVIEDLSKTF